MLFRLVSPLACTVHATPAHWSPRQRPPRFSRRSASPWHRLEHGRKTMWATSKLKVCSQNAISLFRRETSRKITSTPCPPGGPRVVWRWSPRPQVGHIMEPGFPAQQGKYSVGNILCHVRNAHLVFFSLPSLLKGPLPATSKCLVYFPTVEK